MALKDFKAVVTIVPKDPDALKKFKACEKDIREEAFLKAIESENTAGEVDVDPETIPVEDSYTGPRITVDNTTGEPQLTPEMTKTILGYMKEEKLVHKKYVIIILQHAIRYFRSLPSLLDLSLPDLNSSEGTFTVCGDTHGQYYDLLNIFEIGGEPSSSNFYLFNGDFVDRGSFSFETVFALLLWKLTLPNALHMLRGNHETK
jgi:serine/threonine-protein phosphatase 5